MLYLDASLLVALHVLEAHSVDAANWMRSEPADGFAMSEWTVTEFMSALSLKVRTKQISELERGRVADAFAEFTYPTVTLLDIDSADFRAASRMVGRSETGLRAGDALHLAVALRHRVTICTLDRTLSAAALVFGVTGQLVA